MATIEQIHRLSKLPIHGLDRLPSIQQLSRDDSLTPRSCALKEFRFPPPYTGKKKKKKKLPPIPENVYPKRHNTVEDLDIMNIHHLPPLPEISPILTIAEHDPVQLKVMPIDDEDAQSEGGKPNATFGCVREFTFPVSSAKRKRDSHVMKKSKLKELPIQAKIEKLARKKRKKTKATAKLKEPKEEKHPAVSELKFPALHNTTAFKARRDRQTDTLLGMKEPKAPPFKHPVAKTDDIDKPRIPHRLYSKIVDSIYTFSRGSPYDIDRRFEGRREPFERLPVTPVTSQGDRDNWLRTSHFNFPPLI